MVRAVESFNLRIETSAHIKYILPFQRLLMLKGNFLKVKKKNKFTFFPERGIWFKRKIQSFITKDFLVMPPLSP